MTNITEIGDILTESSKEVNQLNPKAVLVYGSYLSQDLKAWTADYGRLYGKGSLFDKKPDYLAIVPDLESAIKELGKQNFWSSKQIDNLLKMKRDTPFYFNLQTREEYLVSVWSGDFKVSIPYKIGIIGEKEFNEIDNPENISKGNVYLPARLSKIYRIIEQKDPEILALIKNKTASSRNLFVDLAFGILPWEFTGEQFTEAYLKTTYLCESYRFFDLFKGKPQKIFKSNIYDFNKNKPVPMREELSMVLAEILSSRQDIERKDFCLGFYQTTFESLCKPGPKDIFMRLLSCNISGISATIKNMRTNSLTSSNLSYVLRKIF